VPCNCNKKRLSGAWVFVSASGTTTKYASEIEAKAAQVRAGGGGTVKPA
jgi:hypothetical protein